MPKITCCCSVARTRWSGSQASCSRWTAASPVTGMMALPMCRRDIGDYLGLTLETVSRALSQLHGEGVLGFSGARQIVLRNRQRLRNMDA